MKLFQVKAYKYNYFQQNIKTHYLLIKRFLDLTVFYLYDFVPYR